METKETIRLVKGLASEIGNLRNEIEQDRLRIKKIERQLGKLKRGD